MLSFHYLYILRKQQHVQVFIQYYHTVGVTIWVCIHGIKRGLPSLMKTKTLPASALEIRRSSSRYVVSNHDWALLLEIENFKGGWLEMVFATDEAVSWTEESMPLNGERSIFCPKNSTFSGNTSESVTWGVPMTPSSNLIWTKKEKKVI